METTSEKKCKQTSPIVSQSFIFWSTSIPLSSSFQNRYELEPEPNRISNRESDLILGECSKNEVWTLKHGSCNFQKLYPKKHNWTVLGNF